MPLPLFPGGPTRFLRNFPVGDTAPVVTLLSPNSGRVAGGLAVTITGAKFRYETNGSAPLVFFGTAQATSVVVVNSTTITCLSPANNPGLYDVTVTSGSQTGTLFAGFTFYTAVLTVVDPRSGKFNGSQRVTVRGNGFFSGMTVKFGGTPALDSTFIDAQNYSVTTPAHATGFVDVTLWDGVTLYDTLRNGFQYTLLVRGEDIRRNPGITIRDVLNNAANTCTFSVDGTSSEPKVGEKIEIIDSVDLIKLFAGTIQSITQDYEGLTDQLVWRVNCVDFTWLMNRKRPFGSWKNTSASSIVKNLIANFAPGFTTNYVQTNLAKVSLTLDGSTDLVTVLSELASAIGGGHWYVDYDQDVHFFHTAPPAGLIPLPPITAMTSLGTPMVVAEGAVFAGFQYTPGYYFFRASFIYSDGSESQLGPISNVLLLDGTKNVNFTSVPLGTNPGALTCVGRRIYYTKLIKWSLGRSSVETVEGLLQINDNATAAFNTNYAKGHLYDTTVATTAAIAAVKTYTVEPGVLIPPFTPGAYVLLSDQAADLGLTGNVDKGSFGLARGWLAYAASGVVYTATTTPNPRVAGDVHYASPAIATVLENLVNTNQTRGPVIPNFGHPVGPSVALTPVPNFVYGPNYFNNSWVQFKVAFLYRDGSVSFPSAASATVGLKYAVKGTGIDGYSFSNIPIGPTIDGLDVVARFIYTSYGVSQDSNYSYNGSVPIGFVWPIPMLDPTWDESSVTGLIVIPNNTTVTSPAPQAEIVGLGSKPYTSGLVITSVDPIPVWPNPDGPNLETASPPSDLTDTNTTLLRDPPFSTHTDLSQVRNRVFVVGAGSTITLTAVIGATSILVSDITSFSPSGGTVKITDVGTGNHYVVNYIGISGVVGATAVTLAQPLAQNISQGSVISNFFQADDKDSQKFLAKVELDKDGLPTDGIHEYTIVDSSLKAVFQLYMRAYAELEIFSRPIVTINYATRDSNSVSGRTVHVDLTNPPCQGDFLIQDVTIDQIQDEADALSPRWTVTASSSRFELNDLLLLIIGKSLGGVGGSSGLVVSAINGNNSTEGSIVGAGFPLRRFSLGYIYATSTAPLFASIGGTLQTSSLGGGGSGSYDTTEIAPFQDHQGTRADQSWYTVATTTAIDAGFGLTLQGCGNQLEENLDAYFEIRTGKSLIGCCLWVGLQQSGLILPPGGTNIAVCSLRFHQGTDSGWTAVVQPQGAFHAQTTRAVAGISPDTYYLCRIQSSVSNRDYRTATVTFTVNGTSTTITFDQTLSTPAGTNPYDMPTARAMGSTPSFLPTVGVVNRVAGTARKMSIRRIAVFSD